MKKILKISRYILGIIFILGGIGGVSESDILGIISILFGVSLFPNIYKRINKYKKMQILIPIILFAIFSVGMEKRQSSTNNVLQYSENILNQSSIQIIDINEINFEEEDIQLDIKESKVIELKYLPDNANDLNIKICINDENLIEAEDIKENQKIFIKLTPLKEGLGILYAQTENGTKSNEVKVNIIDNERIERENEEKERRAKEEAEKLKQEQEAQEKLRQEKILEEKAKQEQAAKEAASQQQKNQQTTTTKPATISNSSSSSSTYKGDTVYITPSGKRYHYSSTCGGKNSTSTTLSNAQSRGYTPCQKCAK